MDENEIARIVVDRCLKIHRTLGPGLLESVENILPVHKKQLLTYLKLTGLKLGLLINFNEALIKNGITRIVNRL
ncbi:MAG: GxxExxY protein [Pseudomonadota bacterium]